MRQGAWKLHFETKGSHCRDTYPDAECHAARVDRRPSGGLLFNVELDVGEVLPVANSTAEYATWAPLLRRLAADYVAALGTVPSETARGEAAERFPCCSPGCTPLPECCTCPQRLEP